MLPGTSAARVGLTLLAALPLTIAVGQPSFETTGPLPASGDVFRSDLASAMSYVSTATVARAEQVEAAREALDRAGLGLSLALEAEPSADYELDTLSGIGAWDVGFSVALSGGLELDEDEVLRMQVALAQAEARLRAQRRADLRDALLALSAARLGAYGVAEAQQDLTAARDELAEASEDGAPEQVLFGLTLDAELAAIELDGELLDQALREAEVTALGLHPTSGAGLLLGPVPVTLSAVPVHGDAEVLELAAQRADLAVRRLPFDVLREVEVTGEYEAGGLEFTSELGLRRGVPGAEAEVGWSNGGSGNGFVIGVGATLVFSHDSPSRTTLVKEERDRAWREIESFQSAQADRERTALVELELAYRELNVLLALRDAADLDLTAAQDEDAEWLVRALARADQAAERAWQRYVRALHEYLDVIDAVLVTDDAN